jgi:hypothetical protein
MMASTSSMLTAWRTTLIVSGRPSSRTHAAAVSFSRCRLVPAMRAASAPLASWNESWTASSPAARSAASRSRRSGTPLVMRLT